LPTVLTPGEIHPTHEYVHPDEYLIDGGETLTRVEENAVRHRLGESLLSDTSIARDNQNITAIATRNRK
jgi:hypothetical protein